MLADPISVTIDTTATNVPRVAMGNMTGQFAVPDGTLKVDVKHTTNGRERSVFKVSQTQNVADPFDPSKLKPYQAQAYLVVDAPPNGAGFTDAQLGFLIKAITTWFSTPANQTAFLGKQA